jgi:hypothetical protein
VNVNTRQVSLRTTNVTSDESIKKENYASIAVYPNPGNGYLQFGALLPINKATIKASLYDNNGHLLIDIIGTQKNIEMAFSKILMQKPTGLYLIRLSIGDRHYQVKYIRE